MSAPKRALRIILRRVERIERICAIVATSFEPVPDNRFCIRRMEVVGQVASVLRVPVSNQLCRSVAVAVGSIGFQPVKSGNRRLFRRARRRGVTEAVALEYSKELRRKDHRE